MGILAEPLAMIKSLKLQPGFSVCELGDQYVTCKTPHYLASEFYRKLGCGRYVSIDGNGRGDVKADLNLPLPPTLGHFDLVTDFGTGEHIFNQFQVWKSVHFLANPDHGIIAFDRPAQGYEAHCFYCTHETLFKDLAAVNGYDILALERKTTPRGELIRGLFRRNGPRKFRIPQQGRYQSSLQI